MYEIYEKHADWYDRLVGAEDYQANLPRALGEIAEWDGASVYEAGVGTGRVTRLYIERAASATLVDRSLHMLDRARENLKSFEEKLTFLQGDNFDLPGSPGGVGDICVEGWAFGHGIVDRAEAARREEGDIAAAVARATRELLESAERVVRPGGRLIILETLGTATDGPTAPLAELALFYNLLEEELGFSHRRIETDYRFASALEAQETMGFFFGEQMAARVGELDSPIIPEWTGLWWR